METVLETEAVYLRAPAHDGLLGVMDDHAPMVAELQIGPVVVTEPSGNVRHFATVQGVMRVKDDEVVMLVAAAEEADRIDVERATRSLERAMDRLRTMPKEQMDIARAEMAVARAANRLKVAESAGL